MDVSPNDAEYRDVLRWLSDQTGLTFRSDQYQHTVAIIDRVMRGFQIDDVRKLLATLGSRREVLSELVNQITIGETYFFREPNQFRFIQQQVLPELRSLRGPSHKLRIWSAGCASGDEPYSLAIVCHRMGIANDVSILATDLSSKAIQSAQRGIFRPWSFRGDAIKEVADYVTNAEGLFQLREHIRTMVRFQELNLAAAEFPSFGNGTSHLDLILCRNVLIYFSRSTVREITNRFLAALAPGGWLIAASGDPPLDPHDGWEIVANEFGTFYRKPLARLSATTSDSEVVSTKKQRVLPPANNLAGIPTRMTAAPSLPRLDAHRTVPGRQPFDKPPRVKLADSLSASRRSVAVAGAALGAGDFQRAVNLTESLVDDPAACAIHVQALATLDRQAAIACCRVASERHPLSEPLHYLYALLLADADRTLEAAQSVQKLLFLNNSSIMGHFLFGSLQAQTRQWELARRHFRRVCELCALHLPNELVPLAEDENVADIATAAAARLAELLATDET